VVPEGNEKRVVHMQLPTGVQVNVFQWKNYMDVEIKMEPQVGQDGVCGNFNGNMGDDTTEAIMKRIGHLVHRNEDMLSGQATVVFTSAMGMMMAKECPASMQKEGRALCESGLGVQSNQVNSCIFDYCFGMNVHARQSAKTYR